MRIEDHDVRNAMDSRLSVFDASAGRRERIRQRVQQEEVVVRKKIRVSAVLAIVALLALASVALAASLNLFEFFGQEDARLKQIAPEATLVTESPQTVNSTELGTAVASINSAYYDGQSLFVAYSIKNGTRTERFVPTEDQLARMIKLDSGIALALSEMSEDEVLIMSEFETAQENGTPYGIVQYSVYPSDQTETDDGIDLPPSRENQESTPEGDQYTLREYEWPLPEAAQDRDSLNIRIGLYQSAYYQYFDGKDLYELPSERQDAGAMVATVSRHSAPTRHYEGEGLYNGVNVRVEVDASAVHATITVIAEADVFTPLNEDSWYMLDVQDAQGNSLDSTQDGDVDLRTLRVPLIGTGTLPDSLSVSISVRSEGEDASAVQGEPILLTMKE